MTQIPRKLLDDLSDELNALSAEGQRMILNVLDNAEWSTVEELRIILVEAMEQICGTMTDFAAARTADFYDNVREASVGEKLGAEPLSGREPAATEGAVRAFLQTVVLTGSVFLLAKRLKERVDYEIKRASGECVSLNAERDPMKPRYARVPAGGDNCSFCIELAGRGFVYKSAETASHAHVNCDCRVVPGFNDAGVEGYDPEEFRHQSEGIKRGTIADEKIYNYLLNPEHESGKHKARLFKKFLGITLADAEYLRKQLYIALGREKLVYKNTDEYGARYYQEFVMEGVGGRKWLVRACWILRPGESKMSLTTAFPVEKWEGGA